jgi:putative lipase involved disintegration of autophagic bodies
VTFEAPPERLAATRLHLLVPPPAPTLPTVQVPLRPWYDVAHITHVYNNADPLAQGNCTGVLSPCAQAGYAVESKCRMGRNIVYDVLKKGWDWGFHSHRMGSVISLLEEDLPVPEAVVQDECEVCHGQTKPPVFFPHISDGDHSSNRTAQLGSMPTFQSPSGRSYGKRSVGIYPVAADVRRTERR